MRTAVPSLLAVTLFAVPGASQKAKSPGTASNISSPASRCLSKGGIGIVNKRLYIVVKSANNDPNELILTPTEGKEERWKGESATKSQIKSGSSISRQRRDAITGELESSEEQASSVHTQRFGEKCAYRSTAIATAFPPPKHNAAIPRFTSRRIIS